MAQLVRVCRSGGTIAMANWTPGGFIGTMFKTSARFIAPPGMPAPVLWGDERVVAVRCGAVASALDPRQLPFDYPFGSANVVELFRQNHGPTTREFASLGEADQAALRANLVNLWTSHNAATEPSRTIVDSKYLESSAFARDTKGVRRGQQTSERTS